MSAAMAGRICIVTGATSGIGRATALGLAQMGATVVIVARDRVRGEAARAEIERASGNERVQLLLADLSSQRSIRDLAAAFQQRHDRLHVLINNAGALNMKRSVTVDGLETTFAVNHLAYFLLTNLLLDSLKASAPARIVNVASQAQASGTIDFDDLQGERRYSGMKAYSQSKLANVLFTYELAYRLQGTGVTANVLHPGVVRTGFGQNNRGIVGTLIRLAGPFMTSPEQGARTSLYLATSPAVEGVSGRYFIKEKRARSSPVSYDKDAALRLWEISERLTGIV